MIEEAPRLGHESWSWSPVRRAVAQMVTRGPNYYPNLLFRGGMNLRTTIAVQAKVLGLGAPVWLRGQNVWRYEGTEWRVDPTLEDGEFYVKDRGNHYVKGTFNGHA